MIRGVVTDGIVWGTETMDPITESISRGVDQLIGRAGGPLHLRLILQPAVATVLAIRAGLRDAREGNPAFLWAVLTSPAERKLLIRSGWKDVGKLFLVAVVLDVIYQIVVLRALYPVQTLIVCVCVALVPYSLLRGPVTRIARLRKKLPQAAAKRAAP